MRNLIVLTVLSAIMLATFQAPVVSAAPSKHAKNVQSTVQKSSKKAPAKKIAPKKVAKKVKGKPSAKPLAYSLATLIGCIGPDGKNFKATQKDCDAIHSFWSKNKPTSPSNNSGSNNSGSSNHNSNNPNSSNKNSAAPVATPTPPVASIASISVVPCTSSSCQWYTTVIVNGSNFTQDMRVELNDGTRTYSENTTFNYPKDAQIVGGNGSTQIITDFYYLPTCQTYSVKVYTSDGFNLIQPSAFSTICH